MMETDPERRARASLHSQELLLGCPTLDLTLCGAAAQGGRAGLAQKKPTGPACSLPDLYFTSPLLTASNTNPLCQHLLLSPLGSPLPRQEGAGWRRMEPLLALALLQLGELS